MATFEKVAERWASDDGKHLKAASMSYRGRKGFSWGTLVAHIVDSTAGPVALVTSDRFSDSTSRASNCFAGAARNVAMLVFAVPNLNAGQSDHHANLTYFEAEAIKCEEKIAKARTVNWQAEADRYRANAKAYRAAFGI
jgi:hypothetical protein